VQSDFSVDALFLQQVCQSVAMNFALEILFDEQQLAEFKKIDVRDQSGARINWVPMRNDELPRFL
jgi:hypothetical protein